MKDMLEGDNMYTCSKCQRKVRAEKRLDVISLVNYCSTVFSLNRNFTIFYEENSLHFNLADFSVDFIKQFVFLW